MYCMECGAEIAAETKFCGKCGASQTVVESAAVVSNANADKPKQVQQAELKGPTSKFARNMKIIFVVVALVMISPWIFLPSSKSKDSTQATPSSTSQQKEAAIAPAVPAASVSIVSTKSNSADGTLNLAQDFANKLGSQTAVSCLYYNMHMIGAATRIINEKEGDASAELIAFRNTAIKSAAVYNGLVKLLPNTGVYSDSTLAWIKSSTEDTLREFYGQYCLHNEFHQLMALDFK